MGQNAFLCEEATEVKSQSAFSESFQEKGIKLPKQRILCNLHISVSAEQIKLSNQSISGKHIVLAGKSFIHAAS